jgi:hypothetical protein
MPFQKGNQLGKNSIHQRRDLTMELIAQLDEVLKYKHPLTKEKRTFKQRIVRNLIRCAATCGDEFDTNGKLIKEGDGDLNAILAIFDRLEGKPSQKLVGPDNGPVQVEYKTIEEVHMFLLERGIDSLRVPPPPLKLISKE